MGKIKYILLSSIIVMSMTVNIYAEEESNKYILGGNNIPEENIDLDIEVVDSNEEYFDLERFFRPSKTAILNDENISSLEEFYNENPYKMDLPEKPFRSGKDTIVNYFTVLREAANPTKLNNTGCGSLGDTGGPYPVAYNFLSDDYKKKMSYKDFKDSFKNILHINLIKVENVPSDEDRPDLLKYFVEMETIEGSSQEKGLFAYYYGYIYLKKEGSEYRIVNMNFTPENYLCAPYHGWSYDAKTFVEIEYGNWCNIIDGDVVVNEEGYEKRAYYKNKYGNEYYVLFIELTNGVDKKMGDYKKNSEGKWEEVYINPEKCIENKS
ncbi:MAG: hypothetical protein RSD36_08745 [Terrisporobacter sp.]